MTAFERPTLVAIGFDSNGWPKVVPGLALWAALTVRGDFILGLVVNFNDFDGRSRSGGSCFRFLLLKNACSPVRQLHSITNR